MCLSHVPLVYEIDGEKIVRNFDKPPQLKSWCHHKDTDPKKWREFCIHALTILYKENCSLSNTSPCRAWLDSIPQEKHTFDTEFRAQLKINKELRNALADKLIEENTPAFWQTINIIAPFLPANVKKHLKQQVQSISNISKIKSIVEQKGLRLINIVIKNKNITLSLSDEKPEECQICFTHFCEDTPLCTTCKKSYACKKCENDIKLKYGRCAFCNSEY